MFTLNNYTEEEVENMKALAQDKCKYMVFGYEIAPKTGTPHLQGYFELQKEAYMSMMHQYCRRLHFTLQPVKGTAQENRKYCLKIRDEDEHPNERFYEFGECPTVGQGNRTDLENAAMAVAQGGFVALNKPEFYTTVVKYGRGLRELSSLLAPKRNFKTEVVVLIGKPGTGKSALASQFPNPIVAPKPNGSSYWFDGYEPSLHDTIILDDYRGNYPLDFFLELTDRYQLTLPIKGGQVQMRAKYLVITSNRKYTEWYPKVYVKYPDQLAAVDRRIDTVVYFPRFGELQVLRGSLPEGIKLPDINPINKPPIQWPDEPSRPDPAPRNIISMSEHMQKEKEKPPSTSSEIPSSEPITLRAYAKMTSSQVKEYKERSAKYKADLLESLRKINN